MIKRRILIVEDEMICQSAVRWKNIFKTTVQTFSVTTMADALDIFMTQEYCLVSLIVAFFSDQTQDIC